MGRLRRLAVMLLLVYTPGGNEAGAEDAEISFVHEQRSLQPGEVVLFNVRSDRPLRNLRIEAFGREFPAVDEDGGAAWTGLIGIDLETKPGRYRLILKGEDLSGDSVVVQKSLNIIAKKFPTRSLSVDEKYVTPPPETTARIEKERKRVNAVFASVNLEKHWSGPFRIPVPGEVISGFGKRNVYNGKPRSPHSGADFRGAAGTRIRAPNAARVVLADDLYFSGNTIILDHGLGLYSYLAHMSELLVKEGDQVKAGDVIGKVGATGRVTGPHLHWTVRLVGARIDPLSLVQVLEKRE